MKEFLKSVYNFQSYGQKWRTCFFYSRCISSLVGIFLTEIKLSIYALKIEAKALVMLTTRSRTSNDVMGNNATADADLDEAEV